MNKAHITEFASLELEQFLCEEMAEETLGYWQNHYQYCKNCREYVEQSAVNRELVAMAEQSCSSDILARQPAYDGMWQKLEREIFTEENFVICFRNSDHLFEQRIPKAKAAGVSGGVPPRISIPEELFASEENISLVFERDAISHDLHIGLRGGSVKTRRMITVKVFFAAPLKEEVFTGKDIAIGGIWSISSDKAKHIAKIELAYQAQS